MGSTYRSEPLDGGTSCKPAPVLQPWRDLDPARVSHDVLSLRLPATRPGGGWYVPSCISLELWRITDQITHHKHRVAII